MSKKNVYRFYDSELETLRTHFILMGEKAIEIVKLAMRSLLERDGELAREAIAIDDDIDKLEVTVDNEAIRFISLRAPVASDLRLLTLGMKAGHELERIGDEAVGIAKRAIRLSGYAPMKEFFHLPDMVDLALRLLRDAIDSFIDEDLSKAMMVIEKDVEVDILNKENYEKFTDYIKDHPDASKIVVDLIFISKSLERVGDHATNIAEEVVYLLSGEDIRHIARLKDSKDS